CGGTVSAAGSYSFTAGASVGTCVMSVKACDSATPAGCTTQNTTLTIYQCMSAAECDDSNTCTTDACTANACTHANVMMGTACNDGLSTTKNDQCNGLGTCAGTPYTCSPGQCEASSTPNGVGCTVVNKANNTPCSD